jgi:hypothetical protein
VISEITPINALFSYNPARKIAALRKHYLPISQREQHAHFENQTDFGF